MEQRTATDDPKKQLPQATIVWRGINLIMSVFFFLAAYVNMNDNDWFLWAPLYFVPGLLSLAVAVRPLLSESTIWNYTVVIHFTLCCAYGLYEIVALLSAMRGKEKMGNPLVLEEGREMGGLLIMIAWAGMSRFTNVGRQESQPKKRQAMLSAPILLAVSLGLVPLMAWGMCFIGDWHKTLGHCNAMFNRQ